VSLAIVWNVCGTTARECVAGLEGGAAFAPDLVDPVIREDYGLSDFEAWLPWNRGGFSPVEVCRGRAEPDAWYDWG